MYNAEAQKKYQNKVEKYTIKFSLSSDDQATVSVLNDLIDKSGMSANAFIKKILTDYVNDYLRS